MNKKTKIDKKDKYQVLLTELLPYELPFWFTNEIIYKHVKNHGTKFFDKNLGKKPKAFKPLDFRIKRTKAGTRILSIMHPQIQLEFCSFYEKYQDLIIYYCNRSSKSLRFPVKPASVFYNKSINNSNADGKRLIVSKEIEDTETDRKSCSSFFKYKKCTFLYRFFESYEYHSLEKKFRQFIQLDVSKCFHNIYTHSISWAVKNKSFAKKNINSKYGFDVEFDKLMQNANYKETNGILIGPEVSRIFAESIFQAIDIKIISKMELEHDMNCGHDYDFRRYVDDYFIFVNNDKTAENLCSVIEEELSMFKLSLNESKKYVSSRPFITEITLCKNELSDYVGKVYSERWTINEDKKKKLKKFTNPSKEANKFIVGIKSILKKYSVEYSSVSNYIIAIFHKHISEQLKDSSENQIIEKDALFSCLLIDIDVVFFIHAMDSRIGPTDKVAHIVRGIITEFGYDNLNLLKKKIFDLGRKAIEIFSDNNNIGFSVEILNMLLVLSMLGKDFPLPKTFIEKHFIIHLRKYFKNSVCNNEHFGGFYFLWITVMLYIKSDNRYKLLQCEMARLGERYFETIDNDLSYTETFLFFFDFISCPFIFNVSSRKIFFEKMKKKFGLSISFEDWNKLFKNRGFIVDWEEEAWMDLKLEKRKFIFPYD